MEPCAFVSTLKALSGLDKLLVGKLQIGGLRLEDPSLNFVKRDDGTWNIVELMDRLSSPRRAPLSFFPAMDITGAASTSNLARAKTTFYIANADLTIYPERSGQVAVQFAGSPARTDRMVGGFGHFRGNANWWLGRSPRANQLEADLTLDPSNLAELTTLFEGYDLGIHGTVSTAHAH